MKDLIISLLVYNQLEVTKKCIESILKNSTTDYILVISDNASREDTSSYLASLHNGTNIIYIRNDENLGYIKAHNNIFKKYIYKSKYFCVLNNDIIINTYGWDKNYINLLESDINLAQVGPIQEFGYLDKYGTGSKRYNNEAADYIEGSCFVVKSSVLMEVEYFEEKYMSFAFCEDADLSLKIRNSGYSILETPINSITHLHNVSFRNEKIDIDFKQLESSNKRFLCDRWQKYLLTRQFEPLNILVNRQAALGDTFCIEPILRELLYKYPGCNIYVDTSCPDGLSYIPYIKELGSGIALKRKYDIIIDLNLSYEKRPTMHIVDAYAQEAKVILNEDERVPIYKDDLKERTKRKTAIVCSQGSWASRTWNIDRWKEFISYLKVDKNYEIIEVGSDPSLYLGIGENKICKLSLDETINLISSAHIYIGFDGGLMHFAQAVRTPVFIIFGCTCPNYRIHDWNLARVVWLDRTQLECAGCHHTRPSPRCHTECDKDKIHCLDNITLDMVKDKFNNGKYNQPTLPVKDFSTVNDFYNSIYECTSATKIITFNKSNIINQNVSIASPSKIKEISIRVGTYYSIISFTFGIRITDINNNLLYSNDLKLTDVRDLQWITFFIDSPLKVNSDIIVSFIKYDENVNIALFKDRDTNNLVMVAR